MKNFKFVVISFTVFILLQSCDLGYKITENSVYYRYAPAGLGSGRDSFMIVGADVKTFEILENKDYTIDKFKVYYHDKEVIGADPSTFIVYTNHICKDKYRYYKGGKRIKVRLKK